MSILMNTPTSISLKHDDLKFLAPENLFLQHQGILAKIELKYYIETDERGEEIEITLPHLCLFSKIDHILHYSKNNFKTKHYIWHARYEKINNKIVTREEYLNVIRYIVTFMAPKDQKFIEYLLQDALNKKYISINDYNKIDDNIVEYILLNSQECNDFLSILPNLHFFSSIIDDIIDIIKTNDDIDFLQYDNFQSLKEKFITSFEQIKLKT